MSVRGVVKPRTVKISTLEFTANNDGIMVVIDSRASFNSQLIPWSRVAELRNMLTLALNGRREWERKQGVSQ